MNDDRRDTPLPLDLDGASEPPPRDRPWSWRLEQQQTAPPPAEPHAEPAEPARPEAAEPRRVKMRTRDMPERQPEPPVGPGAPPRVTSIERRTRTFAERAFHAGILPVWTDEGEVEQTIARIARGYGDVLRAGRQNGDEPDHAPAADEAPKEAPEQAPEQTPSAANGHPDQLAAGEIWTKPDEQSPPPEPTPRRDELDALSERIWATDG